MRRYESRVTEGVLYLETEEDWLEVGPMDEIVGELGETFELEYDEQQQQVPWLETDDGVLRIEVRETLPGLSFEREFVQLVGDAPADEPTVDGERSKRISVYTDLIRKIWEAKGQLDEY